MACVLYLNTARMAECAGCATTAALQIIPKGDRVLVKVAAQEEKTRGGILLPVSAQKRPTSGGWHVFPAPNAGSKIRWSQTLAPGPVGRLRCSSKPSQKCCPYYAAEFARPLTIILLCVRQPNSLLYKDPHQLSGAHNGAHAGDVESLGDGRSSDGTVRPFFLQQGQTVRVC